MLNSKQRAILKGIASNLDAKMQIGKDGVSENSIIQINEMLEKNEITKIKVLKNNDSTAKELCEEIASKTNSEVVYTIGNYIVLYRKNSKKDFKHILK